MKYFTLLILTFFTITLMASDSIDPKPPRVTLKYVKGANKVEVYINNKLFTAYTYPKDMEKPVLYPVHTPKGKAVTRGFPVDPRPGERTDHPHHIGVWLNYGNVNGRDFWNNSYRVSEERKHRFGRIVHQSVDAVTSGDKGILEVSALWKGEDGVELLDESTQFVFEEISPDVYSILRTTTLTAMEEKVTFKDNKEGMFAIRVIRQLEYPTEKPINVVGEDGKPMEEKLIANEGVNGLYLSSKDVTGPGVWGTRAKWMRLGGMVKGGPVSLAILDHPDNVGYPTYWHARTYGLFAANTLGQKIFSKGKNELNFELEPGKAVTFKYKLLVADKELGRGELERMAREFSRE